MTAAAPSSWRSRRGVDTVRHTADRRWHRWPIGLAVLVALGVTVGVGLGLLPSDPAEPESAEVAAASPQLTSVDYHPPPLAPQPPPAAEDAESNTDDRADAAVGDPVRVVIPAIDVDAQVVDVGLLADGAMEVPDFGLAGWYELGPRPGEPGPAVIAAHVDSRDGPDVFFRLDELEAGDEIRAIDADGNTARFVVSSAELVDKNALPVDRIWNEVDEPALRLITCGGEFDRQAGSYRSNTIVYADEAG